MKLSLRLRLIACCVPGFLLVAALAAAGVPGAIVACASVLACGLSGLGVYIAMRSFEQLHDASQGKATWPTLASSEVGPIAIKSQELEDTVTQREYQLHNLMRESTISLQAFVKSQTPTVTIPETPWMDQSEQFAKAITEAGQSLTQSRRRANVLQSVLNDLPLAVLVFDQRKQLQLMNSTAEKWFAHLPNKGLRQTLARFLVEPEASKNHDPDAPRPMQPQEVLTWLNGTRGGACLATVDGPHQSPMLVEISVASVIDRKMSQGLTIILRDVAANRQTDESIRHRQRQLIGKRLSRLVAREAIPSLESIRNAATLLAQAAKQSGLRDRFVPKAQRLLDEVGRQELIAAVLGWFGRSNTTSLGESENREIRMLDLLDDVRTKLASAFSARNNTLSIKGDSGWLFTDEEQLNVLLTGLLLYSTSSAENSEVKVELRRRSIVQAQDEQSEISVRFPGPAPSQDLLEDIRDPFRRPYSTAFDPSGNAGFVLGLAVSQQIATHLYGQFTVEAENGQVCLRLLLPTRADKKQVVGAAEQLTGITHEAASDALEGWSVGGGRTDQQDEEVYEAAVPVGSTAVVDSTPIQNADTLDNWFGSSQN
jgi:nitrogen-specific signal transduction histidine kinase